MLFLSLSLTVNTADYLSVEYVVLVNVMRR